MKKTVCLLLCLALCLSAAACGSRTRVGAYGIRTIQTLVEQDYSLAFRTNDPTADLVIAEVDSIVEVGELDPNNIVTPGILVDILVVKGDNYYAART